MSEKPIKYVTYPGVQGKAVEGVETPDGGAIFNLEDMSAALSCTTCRSIGYDQSPNDPNKCVYCDNPAYPVLKDVSRDSGEYFREMMASRDELTTLRAERDALVKRVGALKEALRAVQTDVATQCPVVMWRGEGGSETTFDYITDALGEDYTYDDWNEGAHRATLGSDGEDG